MAAIAGGTKRIYHTNTQPALILIDFHVWLCCQRCGVSKEGFVFTLTPESNTQEERAERIKDAGPFCCDLCAAEIPFTEYAKNEFLDFYKGT